MVARFCAGNLLDMATMRATPQDHLTTVQLLLDRGADMDAITSNERMTALNIAIEWQNFSIAKLLVERGAKVDRRSARTLRNPKHLECSPRPLYADFERK
jgi:ankyrin repeat protein